MIATALAAAAALTGCSGGSRQVAIGPAPERRTTAALAGNLCTAEGCTCRDLGAPGDGGVGAPEAGKKRFEIRFGPSPQALWARLPNGTMLYKSPEQADACFYVDLATGTLPIELRASAAEGVSAAWAVHEYSPAAHSWYDTFQFACGSPGVCSFTELDGQKPAFAAVKRGLYDKCGSTRIKGLTWDTGKAPDALHPSELLVRFSLDVYKFAPTLPHGDAGCGKRGAGVGGDVGPAADPSEPAPDAAP